MFPSCAVLEKRFILYSKERFKNQETDGGRMGKIWMSSDIQVLNGNNQKPES